MDHTMKLSICTPEKELFNGEVAVLKTENESGELEILFDHMPMITTLKPSVTTFMQTSGEKASAFISNGMLKVKDNEIEILCDAAEWPKDIDLERAKEAKERALKRLENKDEVDVKRAELALMRSLARIRSKQE